MLYELSEVISALGKELWGQRCFKSEPEKEAVMGTTGSDGRNSLHNSGGEDTGRTALWL